MHNLRLLKSKFSWGGAVRLCKNIYYFGFIPQTCIPLALGCFSARFRLSELNPFWSLQWNDMCHDSLCVIIKSMPMWHENNLHCKVWINVTCLALNQFLHQVNFDNPPFRDINDTAGGGVLAPCSLQNLALCSPLPKFALSLLPKFILHAP